jgi:hypothetical protein
MIAPKRIEEGFLIDDLTTGNIDQHASGFHHLEAVFVETPGGLRCPS